MEENIKTKFCKSCGEKINYEAVICPKCGCQVEEIKSSQNPQVIVNNTNTNTNVNKNIGNRTGTRNKWVALALCFFLGVFWAHKFYEGNTGMGIVYLFTFGLCGVGVFIDLISILCKPNMY